MQMVLAAELKTCWLRSVVDADGVGGSASRCAGTKSVGSGHACPGGMGTVAEESVAREGSEFACLKSEGKGGAGAGRQSGSQWDETKLGKGSPRKQ